MVCHKTEHKGVGQHVRAWGKPDKSGDVAFCKAITSPPVLTIVVGMWEGWEAFKGLNQTVKFLLRTSME